MAFNASRSVLDRTSISASIADNLSFACPKSQSVRPDDFWPSDDSSRLFEVVRNGGDDRALSEQEPALQHQRALVVEQLTPPGPDHELRDHDGDDVVLVAGVELVDEP